MSYPFSLIANVGALVVFVLISAILFSLLVWIPQRANQWFGQSIWALAGLSPSSFATYLHTALTRCGLDVVVCENSNSLTSNNSNSHSHKMTSMIVTLQNGSKLLLDASCWNTPPKIEDWQRIDSSRVKHNANYAWIIRSKLDGMGTEWLASQGFSLVHHKSLSQLIKWLNSVNSNSVGVSVNPA